MLANKMIESKFYNYCSFVFNSNLYVSKWIKSLSLWFLSIADICVFRHSNISFFHLSIQLPGIIWYEIQHLVLNSFTIPLFSLHHLIRHFSSILSSLFTACLCTCILLSLLLKFDLSLPQHVTVLSLLLPAYLLFLLPPAYYVFSLQHIPYLYSLLHIPYLYSLSHICCPCLQHIHSPYQLMIHSSSKSIYLWERERMKYGKYFFCWLPPAYCYCLFFTVSSSSTTFIASGTSLVFIVSSSSFIFIASGTSLVFIVSSSSFIFIASGTSLVFITSSSSSIFIASSISPVFTASNVFQNCLKPFNCVQTNELKFIWK